MIEREKEALSALLDNEADDLALRRLLKAVDEEPEAAELLGAWERYHLVQSVLHGAQVTAGPGLSRRVAAAVAETPLPVRSFSPLQANLARVAIAASVAVAVFFSLQGDFLAPVEPPPPQISTAVEQHPEADVAANVRLYLERVYGTEEREPVHMEHLQDSPLYRLVNELRAEGVVPYTPAP